MPVHEFREIYRAPWGKRDCIVNVCFEGYLHVTRFSGSRILRYIKPPGKTWLKRAKRSPGGWKLASRSEFHRLIIIELEALQSLQVETM